MSEEREARWRHEQLEREHKLRIEAEEREAKRKEEAEQRALELKKEAEMREQQYRLEVEERDRKRDAQFNALINQLAQSTSASLALTKQVEEEKLKAVKRQDERTAERWEKDRQDREKKTALSAIPAPQPMAKDQDS